MSPTTDAATRQPIEHGSSDPQAHGDEHAQGSLRSYLVGFFLSVALTAVPFWLVMSDALADKLTTSIVIMAFAAVQIVVHMIYFLHMNTKSEGGWTFISMVFTLTLVVVTLVGSIWVMYNLDENMMPMAPHEAPAQP